MKNSKIEVEIFPGPACLASALINGDLSGLTGEDETALRNFLKITEGYDIVSTRDDPETGESMDPYFSWSCDLYGAPWKGGDLVDYVGLKRG